MRLLTKFAAVKNCLNQIENIIIMEFENLKKADLRYIRKFSLNIVLFVILVFIQYGFTYTDKATTAGSPGSIVASEFNEVKEIGNDEILSIAEIMPTFPGGELALRKFIAKAIRYPNSASENGIQGRVFVKFVVNKEGVITDAKIARGVEPSIDKEAIRVIMSLPKWSPGMHNGLAVNVYLMFPITFQLL